MPLLTPDMPGALKKLGVDWASQNHNLAQPEQQLQPEQQPQLEQQQQPKQHNAQDFEAKTAPTSFKTWLEEHGHEPELVKSFKERVLDPLLGQLGAIVNDVHEDNTEWKVEVSSDRGRMNLIRHSSDTVNSKRRVYMLVEFGIN